MISLGRTQILMLHLICVWIKLILIDRHLPLRKMTKREIKTNSKPWITPDICNSIKRRDALYRKYLRSKYPTNKNELKE